MRATTSVYEILRLWAWRRHWVVPVAHQTSSALDGPDRARRSTPAHRFPTCPRRESRSHAQDEAEVRGDTRKDPSATLDDLREAVTTLVETDRIARRVLGTAHPLTKGIEGDLQYARAALDARETPPSSGN